MNTAPSMSFSQHIRLGCPRIGQSNQPVKGDLTELVAEFEQRHQRSLADSW